MRLIWALRLIVVVAAAALLAGCTILGGSASRLEGTSWRLVAWSDSAIDPGGFTITAQFADGKITGRSAVNSYGGSYKAGADGSFSSGTIASTLMAGPEPAMRAESTYLGLLGGASSYKLDGNRLRLFDKNSTESLVFEKAAQ
ncbi:MAG: META domain-containing protein [Coriobacteriia bacterium]|nr:META domain-containing protein [Coriobacteriia bacterium]